MNKRWLDNSKFENIKDKAEWLKAYKAEYMRWWEEFQSNCEHCRKGE